MHIFVDRFDCYGEGAGQSAGADPRDHVGGERLALARFLRAKEDDGTRIYDLMRPSLTQDGIVSEDIQRKSLEHVVDRVGLKEALRLEKIFDYSVAARVRNELRGRGGGREKRIVIPGADGSVQV